MKIGFRREDALLGSQRHTVMYTCCELNVCSSNEGQFAMNVLSNMGLFVHGS